ncbi:hypothetical protein GCM10022290_28500 [Sagittula marina]
MQLAANTGVAISRLVQIDKAKRRIKDSGCESFINRRVAPDHHAAKGCACFPQGQESGDLERAAAYHQGGNRGHQ